MAIQKRVAKSHPLEKQISLLAPEDYALIEDRAIVTLTHYVEDIFDFEDLIEHLGLREALCRMKSNLVI